MDDDNDFEVMSQVSADLARLQREYDELYSKLCCTRQELDGTRNEYYRWLQSQMQRVGKK